MTTLAPLQLEFNASHDDDDDSSVADEDAWMFQRKIKDPIHGYIVVSRKLCQLIDTPHFQRMKRIKQLGTSYSVWAGASHNRFEHCLGVAHLARLMVKHLQERQPELAITARDVDCVEIAGLCHDLGHGPWSHVWDGIFIPKALQLTPPPNVPANWRHEDASEMMFDHMLQMLASMDIHPVPLADGTFIKALIAGKAERCPDEKKFLFDVVANARTGLDVDKADYLARDSHQTGEGGNNLYARLIDAARVIDDEICFNITNTQEIYSIFQQRFNLHKRIYNHKTARAVEYMIVDALLIAEPHMKIAERILDPERYLYLTDSIMEQIEASTEPELAPARAILNRIHFRQLYRMLDWVCIEWKWDALVQEKITEDAILEMAKTVAPTRPDWEEQIKTLSAQHIIVDISHIHHGKKERNPLDNVKFFSKYHPYDAISARQFVTTVLPASFGEIMLRIYTRDEQYGQLIQAAYRALSETLPSEVWPEARTVDAAASTGDIPTPPITEAASTPQRSFSQLPDDTTATPQAGPSRQPNSTATKTPGANPFMTNPTLGRNASTGSIAGSTHTSPSAGAQTRGAKRKERQDEPGGDGSPKPKSRRMLE